MLIIDILCCIFSLYAGYRIGLRLSTRLVRFFCKNGYFQTIIFMLLLSSVASGIDRQPLYAEETFEGSEMDPSRLIINPDEYLVQAKACQMQYASYVRETSTVYCDAIFDQILCWPPTKAGSNVTQNCPKDVDLVDPNGKATRYCGPKGRWFDKNFQTYGPGWTNYLKCFSESVQILLNEAPDTTTKITVAVWIRVIELIGLSCSSLSLGVGIGIFVSFTSLLNKRTRIHLHLFVILLCQCLLTLTIYIDQETLNLMGDMDHGCKVFYIVLEYLQSNSFFFMLLEGFTLYRTVSDNVTLLQVSYRSMIIFGYISPLINTIIWVIVCIIYYEPNKTGRCWFAYNLDKIYWILQGPRLAVIVTNIFFLMGVVHILITKLRHNNKSDIERARKACRATILLMPLLGITNFLSMTAAPVRGPTISFATWAFFAYVFKSFQGFIIVYIYCFTNAEVQEVIKNYFEAKRRNKTKYAVRFRARTSEPEVEVLSREVEQTRWFTQNSENPTSYKQSPGSHVVEIHTEDRMADNGNLKTLTRDDSEKTESRTLKSPSQHVFESCDDDVVITIHEEDDKIAGSNGLKSPSPKDPEKIE